MLTFFLNTNQKIPLYEQLYNYIKKAIEDNELRTNEKLPSKRKLAQHLKVSVITVETAYNQLLAEGYINSIPKSGYYVSPYIRLVAEKKKSSTSGFKQKPKPDYIVDFKTNQVDKESFPYHKFAKIEKEVTTYGYSQEINKTDYLGLYSLRTQISKLLYSYRGINALPESIVIGSGSEHLISLLVLLLGRDKTYGVEEPGYLKNYRLYLDYGAKAKTINMDEQGVDLSKTDDIDILHVTPSHQFPKGTVTTIQRRTELLNWAYEKKNRYIIEDDYDSEFRFSGIPIPAMKSLETGDKVIYMNSFSKSIAPSLRVSFMVLPDSLLRRYDEQFSYFTCSVPVITQLVLEKFIKDLEYEKHLNRMKNIYKNKRDYLIEKLKNSEFGDKIDIIGAESGLHFLMNLDTKKDVSIFVEAAKKNEVRVYGLYEYFLEKRLDSSENTVILGYSHLNESDISKAVDILEKAWRGLF